MDKIKVYNAGALFNEAEQNQRRLEGKKFKEYNAGDLVEVYNPIDAPFNDKSKKPTAIDIFEGDTKEVIAADVVFADITNHDPGVMMELGVAYGISYARKIIEQMFAENDEEFKGRINEILDGYGIKEKEVYAICSDMRVDSAGEYSHLHIPVGWNQYVIGGIESMDHVFFKDFDRALATFMSRLFAQ